MTNYTWTDNMMRSGSACDVDKVADNLMHLKYNAGGLLQINNLGTVTSNFTLDINEMDVANITSSITISLPTTGLISGVENKCILNFTTTSTSSPILPTGLKWSNNNSGVAPKSYSTLSAVRNVLIFTTIDGGTTWQAEYKTYGAVETAFIRPNLTSNGTMGGSSAACESNANFSGEEPYRAFDSDTTGTQFNADTIAPSYLTFYYPNTCKFTSITVTNSTGTARNAANYTVYGSNDNTNWTTLTSGTNTNNTAIASWNISIPSNNQGWYKYYKIYVSSTIGGYPWATCDVNFTGTYIST